MNHCVQSFHFGVDNWIHCIFSFCLTFGFFFVVFGPCLVFPLIDTFSCVNFLCVDHLVTVAYT